MSDELVGAVPKAPMIVLPQFVFQIAIAHAQGVAAEIVRCTILGSRTF